MIRTWSLIVSNFEYHCFQTLPIPLFPNKIPLFALRVSSFRTSKFSVSYFEYHCFQTFFLLFRLIVSQYFFHVPRFLLLDSLTLFHDSLTFFEQEKTTHPNKTNLSSETKPTIQGMSCTSKYPKGICSIAERPDVALAGEFYPVGTVIGKGGQKSLTSYSKIMGVLRNSNHKYYTPGKNAAELKNYNLRCEGPLCNSDGGFMRVKGGVVTAMEKCKCLLQESRFDNEEALKAHDFVSTDPEHWTTNVIKKREALLFEQVRTQALKEAILYLVEKAKHPIVYKMDGNFRYNEPDNPVYRSKNSKGDYYYDLGLAGGELMQIRITVKDQTEFSKSFS